MANGDYTSTEVIGALLKGGACLFGVRVELSWPDGAPYSEDDLRSIGEGWAPLPVQEWVRADARFCAVPVRCGLEIVDGKCLRHGEAKSGG